MPCLDFHGLLVFTWILILYSLVYYTVWFVCSIKYTKINHGGLLRILNSYAINSLEILKNIILHWVGTLTWVIRTTSRSATITSVSQPTDPAASSHTTIDNSDAILPNLITRCSISYTISISHEVTAFVTYSSVKCENNNVWKGLSLCNIYSIITFSSMFCWEWGYFDSR